jgi:hypothetical protein
LSSLTKSDICEKSKMIGLITIEPSTTKNKLVSSLECSKKFFFD